MEFIVHNILYIVLLFAGLVTFLWLMLFRERLNMTWYAALILSIIHVFYGVACVKVFAFMEGSGIGSMSIYGAVFFMPVGYFIGAKLFKCNLEDAIIASNANIGGPTTAAGMAISQGWAALVGPAMLVGTLGYVIGNYAGTLVGMALGA